MALKTTSFKWKPHGVQYKLFETSAKGISTKVWSKHLKTNSYLYLGSYNKPLNEVRNDIKTETGIFKDIDKKLSASIRSKDF